MVAGTLSIVVVGTLGVVVEVGTLDVVVLRASGLAAMGSEERGMLAGVVIIGRGTTDVCLISCAVRVVVPAMICV